MFCTTIHINFHYNQNKFKKRILQINSTPRHDHKHNVVRWPALLDLLFELLNSQYFCPAIHFYIQKVLVPRDQIIRSAFFR